jgi:uncharacterized protein (DUF2141 family)
MIKHYIIYLLLLSSCASIQSLEGGLKDEIPPKIMSSTPDSAKLFVTNNKISIQLDEYVRLQNINNLLLISPSQKTPPTATIKGKNVNIQLNDSLLPNTTYTININGSIVDYNEGNPLNEKLIFSTGGYIDSLTHSGVIVEKQTNKPCNNCNIYLYTTTTDSTILFNKPDYIARTNEVGQYLFTNLPPAHFTLIAIQDENKNTLLDAKEHVSMYHPINIDTIPQITDTTYIFPYLPYERIKPSILKISSPGLIKLAFKNQIKDQILFIINNVPIDPIVNNQNDTFTLLYTPISDTSRVSIYYLSDTIILNQIEISINKEPRILIDELDATYIKLSTNQRITKLDPSKALVLQDSIKTTVDSIANVDNTITIYGKFDNLKNTLIILDSNFVTTISNTISLPDSLHLQKSNESDPKLTLSIKAITDTLQIIEIIQKEQVKKIFKIKSDTIININYLPSGIYNIRVTVDINANGTWDTGDPIRGTRPEPVFILTPFELRNNWDKELLINNIQAY